MYEGPVQDLIDELGRLPGIGPKSAQRLAFHILAADADDVLRLADTLRLVKDTVKFCEICFNVSEESQCRVCRDPRRDPSLICVVEESKDVVAVERLGVRPRVVSAHRLGERPAYRPPTITTERAVRRCFRPMATCPASWPRRRRCSSSCCRPSRSWPRPR